jgi:hypothetical protein
MSGTTVNWAAGTILRGFRQEDDFSYSTVLTPTGASLPAVTYDANVIGTTTSSNFRINVYPSFSNKLAEALSFISLTPTIVSVDADGVVTALPGQAGPAKIRITCSGISRDFSFTANSSGLGTVSHTVSYLPNSLGESATAAVLALISGKIAQGADGTFGGTQSRFTKNNGATDGTNDAEWNTPTVNAISPFFADSIRTQLCAICIANSSWPQHPVLVTARHIFFATHVASPIGTLILFMRPDGTKQLCTVLASTSVGNDHWVGYLDQAVIGITPMPIMPNNWKSYVKSCDNSVSGEHAYGNIPVIAMLAHTTDLSACAPRLSCLSLSLIKSSSTDFLILSNDQSTPLTPALTDSWFAWSNKKIIPGDSGGIFMMLVSGSPVLLGSISTGSGANSIEYDATGIESAMRTLATQFGDNFNYVLTRENLTSLNSY